MLGVNSQFVRTVPLHFGRKPMIRDGAVTNKYVVVLELPVLLTLLGILKPRGP